MNTLTWRLLTAEELTRVYLNEMRRDFPPTELKPLSMVLNSEAVGDSHTWGVYDGETLVAYLLMVRPRGATVSQLDYFAVLPACRAAGLGAKLLAALPVTGALAAAALRRADALLLDLMLLPVVVLLALAGAAPAVPACLLLLAGWMGAWAASCSVQRRALWGRRDTENYRQNLCRHYNTPRAKCKAPIRRGRLHKHCRGAQKNFLPQIAGFSLQAAKLLV